MDVWGLKMVYFFLLHNESDHIHQHFIQGFHVKKRGGFTMFHHGFNPGGSNGNMIDTHGTSNMDVTFLDVHGIHIYI